MKIKYHKSPDGYGRSWTLIVNGKHRVRWNTTKALTPLWPHLYNGSDEDCNRSTSLHLWPLFGIDVWWEPHWRPKGSGPCPKCIKMYEEEDIEWAEVSSLLWEDITKEENENPRT